MAASSSIHHLVRVCRRNELVPRSPAEARIPLRGGDWTLIVPILLHAIGLNIIPKDVSIWISCCGEPSECVDDLSDSDKLDSIFALDPVLDVVELDVALQISHRISPGGQTQESCTSSSIWKLPDDPLLKFTGYEEDLKADIKEALALSGIDAERWDEFEARATADAEALATSGHLQYDRERSVKRKGADSVANRRFFSKAGRRQYAARQAADKFKAKKRQSQMQASSPSLTSSTGSRSTYDTLESFSEECESSLMQESNSRSKSFIPIVIQENASCDTIKDPSREQVIMALDSFCKAELASGQEVTYMRIKKYLTNTFGHAVFDSQKQAVQHRLKDSFHY